MWTEHSSRTSSCKFIDDSASPGGAATARYSHRRQRRKQSPDLGIDAFLRSLRALLFKVSFVPPETQIRPIALPQFPDLAPRVMTGFFNYRTCFCSSIIPTAAVLGQQCTTLWSARDSSPLSHVVTCRNQALKRRSMATSRRIEKAVTSPRTPYSAAESFERPAKESIEHLPYLSAIPDPPFFQSE